MFLTTQLECCSDDARVLIFTLTSLLQRLGLSPSPSEGPSLEQQARERVERSNQREVQLLYLRFFNILMSRRKVKEEDGKVRTGEPPNSRHLRTIEIVRRQRCPLFRGQIVH